MEQSLENDLTDGEIELLRDTLEELGIGFARVGNRA